MRSGKTYLRDFSTVGFMALLLFHFIHWSLMKENQGVGQLTFLSQPQSAQDDLIYLTSRWLVTVLFYFSILKLTCWNALYHRQWISSQCILLQLKRVFLSAFLTWRTKPFSVYISFCSLKISYVCNMCSDYYSSHLSKLLIHLASSLFPTSSSLHFWGILLFFCAFVFCQAVCFTTLICVTLDL